MKAKNRLSVLNDYNSTTPCWPPSLYLPLICTSICLNVFSISNFLKRYMIVLYFKQSRSHLPLPVSLSSLLSHSYSLPILLSLSSSTLLFPLFSLQFRFIYFPFSSHLFWYQMIILLLLTTFLNNPFLLSSKYRILVNFNLLNSK